MADELWVVPGAPLPAGDGWRVWFSWPERRGDFRPADPGVSRPGSPPPEVDTQWTPLKELPDVGRRAGILTVTLTPATPGAAYDLVFPDLAPRQVFTWRTLPQALDDGVTLLMGSCFWLNDDREGRYAAAVTELVKRERPVLKILMGDQLYVDWPARLDRGSHPHRLYAERYLEYWGDEPYRRMLQTTPTLFACDDHEFWNNFPERQWQAPWTILPGPRTAAATAARDLFEHFQHSCNPDGERYFELDIGDVSLFVTDSRSERTPFDAEPRGFFTPRQWERLEAWAAGLRGPGLLVLSQPLFQKDGDFKDYSLGNFTEDRAHLLQLFEQTLDADPPHDIVVLTGDIHTGRHAVATIAGRADAAAVHELVTSPASLVGPFQPLQKPNMPPPNIGGPGVKWDITLTEEVEAPTVANNVGLLRLAPGRNGTTRLTFEIWRVRKYDNRRYWERWLDRPRPEGDLKRLLSKEIELR